MLGVNDHAITDFDKKNNLYEKEIIEGDDASSKTSEEDSSSVDHRANMFRLLRFFSLTSAVAFMLVTVAFVVLIRQHAKDMVIEAAELQNVTLARSFANILWPKYAPYVMSISGLSGAAMRARDETREIHETLRRLTEGLPILKVKIYGPDGMTVYSSDPDQIGRVKANNLAFLSSAQHGIPESKLDHRHSFGSFSGVVTDRDLVESYLPIWGSDGEIEGVFEIYSDVSREIAVLEHRSNELAFAVLMTFATLYVILFLIVRRADRVVKWQYFDLLESRESISEKNAALLREVTARERLAQDLLTSEQGLRKLSERLIDAQEEERTRIARELHDGIGQGLTDIKFRVERAIELSYGDQNGSVGDYLRTVIPAVQANVEEVRRISMGLRPSILDDIGILSTIAWSCREFEATHPLIEVTAELLVAEHEVPEDLKTTIYRSLQEGLTNISKHAKADCVRVGLVETEGRLEFTISDNGQGIANCRAVQDDEAPRFGLSSLRERAGMSGGSFSIRSENRFGTTLRATWPLRKWQVTGRASPASRRRPSAPMRYADRAFS